MSVRYWLLVVCTFACTVGAGAQTATLLKDINTTTDVSYSSEPRNFTEFKGASYFFASSTPGVTGLWRTDGTAAGTKLVRNNLDGGELTVSGGLLFFAGDDGISGSELWKSDGTEAGTVLVKDINNGPGDGVPSFSQLADVDGTLYFEARNAAGVWGLWKSDGTAAGTVLVQSSDTTVGLLGALDGMVYFSSSDGVNGTELWRTDGTPAGTMMVRDINPGPGSSDIYAFAETDGSFLFVADDRSLGVELWRSDGTTAGTTMVVDLNLGAGNGIVNPPFSQSGIFKNLLYFGGNNGDGSGPGLWKSDGTIAGTVRVVSGVNPAAFENVANLLYFIDDGGFDGSDVLWRSDGTTAGSMALKELPRIGSDLASFGGALYFSAPGIQSSLLWKTNGTEAGTVVVKGFYPPEGLPSKPPGSFAVLSGNPISQGVLLFRADDGEHGAELWKTNGSGAGTVMITDIGQGTGDSNPRDFTKVGGELYFTALGDAGVRTQWKTDGTVAGTVPTGEVAPLPREPGYFAFDDGVNGRELWRTDGTEAGARLVKDINPGPADGVAEDPELVLIGGTLFFPADDGVNGLELWKSDGTAAGTVLVRNVFTTSGIGSAPRLLVDLNGTLIFFANSGQSFSELWRSDGTEAGTVLVQDLRLIAPTGGAFLKPTVSNGLLFFIAAGPGTGYDLWRTDGTASGTVFLKDLHSFFVAAPEVLDVGGKLFFSFQDIFPVDDGLDLQGTLWTSDGTIEGTQLVKAFDYAPEAHNPVSHFTNYGGTLHFVVQSPTGRGELWESDGTEEGTVRAQVAPTEEYSIWQILGEQSGSLFLDITEGVNYASPHHVARLQGTAEMAVIEDTQFLAVLSPAVSRPTAVGSHFVFSGRTEATGNELWAMPLLPAISSSGVVDAAGYLPTLVPGGLASLFGVELADDTAAASGFPLPTTLAGAKVKVNGIDAPLLFVSPTQINFQVPYETPLGASVSVVATLTGQQSLSEPTVVAEFAPAIFVNPVTGEPIVQRHADGALITAQNPAQPGDTLILYVTGIGGLDNPPVTGEAATDSPLAMSTVVPTVSVGQAEAIVLFAGLAPDFAGLGQINIELPETLPQGSPLPLTIRFGDSASPTLELPL